MWFFKSCCCCCSCCYSEPINSFDNFSYRGITEAPDLQRTDSSPYRVHNQGINGISLIHIKKRTENSRLQVGWKFHIAIDLRDIAKAWNATKDIFMRLNIIETKMIAREYLERMPVDKLGREITIYAFKESNDMDWWPIIQELEAALRAVKVRSIPHSPATEIVPNCEYFSFRCDRRPIPPQYEYMPPHEFYSNRSISVNMMYLGIEDALRIAATNGTSPANPYNFAIPNFITNLFPSSAHNVSREDNLLVL
jgi:hypothetical protein